MKTFLVSAVLFLLLVAAMGVAGAMWIAAGEAELSLHGLLAMVAGIVLALGLGIGLMALAFYSSRRGYDEEAGRLP